jgi:hypothetical protein
MRHINYAIKGVHLAAAGLTLAITGTLVVSPAAGASVSRPAPPKIVYAITVAPHSALYRLNPRAHTKKLVGHAGVELTDLTFRGKTLYAVSFTSLYRLNTKTGRSHFIGALGFSTANALATRPKTHALYGADTAGNFFKVNTRTGRAKLIGVYGHGLGSLGDLTFAGGRLYASVFRAGSTSSLLARINIRTGAAKIIGRIRYANVYGLVTGRGTLYGATFGGKFLAISRSTGRGKLIWKDGLAIGGLTSRS